MVFQDATAFIFNNKGMSSSMSTKNATTSGWKAGDRSPKIWKGKLTFIMAAAGSAVGLGNLWKFPYIAGENGGGAFVLVYLAFILCFGIPLLAAEIGIGRSTRKNAYSAFDSLAEKTGANKHWKKVGGLAISTSYLILSFYTVVAGWCLYYFYISATGRFNDPAQSFDKSFTSGIFEALLASPISLIIFSTIFLGMTYAIVTSGVVKGIEKTINWLMPSMMLMLTVLIGYSAAVGDFDAAVEFLFMPDFSKLTLDSIIIALGHSFFTLSLASAAMITYGSYMPTDNSIPKTAFAVAGVDILVALTAGLAIFPLVFKYGLEPGAGPGLMFISLPLIFNDMPYGQLFGSAFFFMMFIAALTSAISLMEPTVAWLEQRFNWTRNKSAALTTLSLWVVSLGTVLSLNEWDSPIFFGKTLFDALDYLTANVFMTAGALATAIFCGFCLKQEQLEVMFGKGSLAIPSFKFTMRYLAPLFVATLTLASI
ncbi:sodium-dependent transporter [Halomonas sp. HG01]|uniref:sodium-dependent transporter n=1 Tax=Halomonas sp. HG01 TaxID=1609967 RepID=UPI000A624686|nr:sodium-dependent transporter [Halomonas sp. HG01]